MEPLGWSDIERKVAAATERVRAASEFQ